MSKFDAGKLYAYALTDMWGEVYQSDVERLLGEQVDLREVTPDLRRRIMDECEKIGLSE